jgi:hypothetical protein
MDRVAYAVELAREHMRWATKGCNLTSMPPGKRRSLYMEALGYPGLIEGIGKDHCRRRIAALAASWLALGLEAPVEQVEFRRAA